jgi:hypothetical protein
VSFASLERLGVYRRSPCRRERKRAYQASLSDVWCNVDRANAQMGSDEPRQCALGAVALRRRDELTDESAQWADCGSSAHCRLFLRGIYFFGAFSSSAAAGLDAFFELFLSGSEVDWSTEMRSTHSMKAIGAESLGRGPSFTTRV